MPRPTLLAAALALAAPAAAPADDPAKRGFDVDPSRPAALAGGGFGVETAAPQGAGTRRLELLLDYAHGLLAADAGGGQRADVVHDRWTLHLLGSWSFGPVEVGAHLPLAVHQRTDLSALTDRGVTGPLVAPIAASGLGDARLLAKVPMPWHPAGLDLAGIADLRLPTGDGQDFLSDGTAFAPQLAVGRQVGGVRLDGTVGWLFRSEGQYLQLVVPQGLLYGAAAQVPLPPAGKLRAWSAILDVAGGWPHGDVSTDRFRIPLSVRAGVRARVWRDLAVDVGAGSGFAFANSGYGRELYRVFLGLRWERLVPARAPPDDRDGDGVPDAQDRCPDQPGPAELEGCPDRDGDGVPDIDDKCPDVPGPAQNDGCPPPADEPLVEIETDRLSLKDAITFDTGRDTLRSESTHILDEVARILAQHAELSRVRIEGHTDNVGGRAYNQDLSQRRARAVLRALVQRGVAAGRLESQGYGFDRPVASNATAAGRAKNRRVEFTILGERGGPSR